MSRPLSQNPILFYLGYGVSLLSVGFGVNAFINPANALSWFELQPPSASLLGASPSAQEDLYNVIMPVYGARNIQAGLVMAVAAYCRQPCVLGAAILGFAGCAFVDGWACWRRGDGEWNHWCYVGQLVILGSLLLGVADGKKKAL